jgi:hypothetical protein
MIDVTPEVVHLDMSKEFMVLKKKDHTVANIYNTTIPRNLVNIDSTIN